MGTSNGIAKFEKVSFKQFVDSYSRIDSWKIKEMYEELKLPSRATSGSAGYDFFLPQDMILYPGESGKIPTGIRCKMDLGWALLLYPRSGLGFKYRLQLSNTVGIIDSDYYYSDNEGHIFAKITNDTNEGKVISLRKGERFIQGIFMPYGLTTNDYIDKRRNGGFGSTGR